MRRRNEVHAQAVRWLRLAKRRPEHRWATDLGKPCGGRYWLIGSMCLYLECYRSQSAPTWQRGVYFSEDDFDGDGDGRRMFKALLHAVEAYAAAGGKQ